MKSIQLENNDISAATKFVKDQILSKFGRATFDSWFANIAVSDISKNLITIKVKTRFIKEWVNCNYYDDLFKICKEINHSIVKIDFITDSSNESNNSELEKVHAPSKCFEAKKLSHNISGSVNTRYQFADFITGEENIIAYSAAQNLAKNSLKRDAGQILYIHSNVGLGKTHLVQSIANHIKSVDSTIEVAYFSSERFAYNYVKYIREGKIIDFKDYFQSVDVLLIDDVQFLAGKKATQEELLHIANSFISENKTIVFTGDKGLNELENVDNRLVSKLSAGFVTKINNPDKQLLARIVYARFQKININISEFWLRTIIDTVSSIRDVEGILSKFHALKSINQDYNFDNLMHVILNDYVSKPQSGSIDIKKISDVVTKHYDLKKSDIKSKVRSKKLVRARQIIMYLAKDLTSESLDTIGKESANRNHATVIYSIRAIEAQLKTDTQLVNELDFIRAKL
ncbi:MAG: chromosomal replication initiator protein DnaA [Rickettsiales bacterium]|jgi:chromosomal replication initiator protein|nr:chromosomal replication initiator protein DnaA [Rickettsiales bacterium]